MNGSTPTAISKKKKYEAAADACELQGIWTMLWSPHHHGLHHHPPFLTPLSTERGQWPHPTWLCQSCPTLRSILLALVASRRHRYLPHCGALLTSLVWDVRATLLRHIFWPIPLLLATSGAPS
jgi:hypothetical protein